MSTQPAWVSATNFQNQRPGWTDMDFQGSLSRSNFQGAFPHVSAEPLDEPGNIWRVRDGGTGESMVVDITGIPHMDLPPGIRDAIATHSIRSGANWWGRDAQFERRQPAWVSEANFRRGQPGWLNEGFLGGQSDMRPSERAGLSMDDIQRMVGQLQQPAAPQPQSVGDRFANMRARYDHSQSRMEDMRQRRDEQLGR